MAYAFGRYPPSRLHLGCFDASNTSRKTKMLSVLNEKNTEQNIFLHRCVNKTSSSPFDKKHRKAKLVGNRIYPSSRIIGVIVSSRIWLPKVASGRAVAILLSASRGLGQSLLLLAQTKP
ncbi:hypothetical protein C7M84_013783 [Penaeus vannamei]|uniref:Uncharacterized protein n=1 Tax=Penaeus vannamei TaxID=6689 RepID=A0A3R7LYQ2_PENVA|nr:hypothetical protein C7M84_013783 [Penaeus vannamei]